MTTLADYLEKGMPTGLIGAVVALWPTHAAGAHYAEHTLQPLIQRLQCKAILASCAIPGLTPSEALLASLGDLTAPPPSHVQQFHESLDQLMERHRTPNFVSVLILENIDRWADPLWSDDVAAFRTWLQAHRGQVFVVYQCTERRTIRFLFQTSREPLYGQGLILQVNADGEVL